MKKLTNGNTWDNDLANKIDELIDENEKLKADVEGLKKHVTALAHKERVQELWELFDTLPTDDKPVQDKVSELAQGMVDMGNMLQESDTRRTDKPEPVAEDPGNIVDTHRTVTLRIPKGMRIGEAIAKCEWKPYGGDHLYRLAQASDTDLQKALDEVKGESNE